MNSCNPSNEHARKPSSEKPSEASQRPSDPQQSGETGRTTMHVQRAAAGDAKSLSWIIAHLTPLLAAQADYRLGAALRKEVDAEDLVNGAWVVALPRLGELQARDGRLTPVLLKFLSTSIILQVKRLVARRRLHPDDEGPAAITEIPDETRGPATRIANEELHERVGIAIAELAPRDREVIILRGIEQHPARDVAAILEISPPAVDQRYSRALKRLREQLPNSVFDEF